MIDGMHRVIKSRRKTIDTTKFMSLVSEIETLLDLLGYAVTNIDTLVEHYACDKWKNEFALLSDSRDKNQSIGKWISEIRNTITHPKSASKKSNGKYLPIVQDELKLQKIYAYIGGLYIKAILSYIGGINNDHLEKYIEQLITNRASFYKIEYT